MIMPRRKREALGRRAPFFCRGLFQAKRPPGHDCRAARLSSRPRPCARVKAKTCVSGHGAGSRRSGLHGRPAFRRPPVQGPRRAGLCHTGARSPRQGQLAARQSGVWVCLVRRKALPALGGMGMGTPSLHGGAPSRVTGADRKTAGRNCPDRRPSAQRASAIQEKPPFVAPATRAGFMFKGRGHGVRLSHHAASKRFQHGGRDGG